MDTLTTAVMLGITERLFKFNPFFLMMFFPNEMIFDTEEIHFDKISQSGKLAPFVSPMVAGKANRKQGFARETLLPAYVKPKDIINPKLPIKVKVGEKAGGTLTPAQRRQWWRTHLLGEQDMKILRREEWLAVQAVVNGKVIIEGEDYPAQEVDFKRSADNNITLVGAAKWVNCDVTTYDPTDDIEDWAMFANGPVNIAVMDKTAWRLFKRFKVVKDMLKTDSGSRTKMETGPKDLGMTASYKGTFGADLEIWVYNGQYEDDAGVKQPFLPDGTVILGNDGYQGVRAYGAIQDAKANDQGVFSAKRYPKNWFTDDPSVENIMTQSAPLMVTEDADAFVVIRI